MAYTINFYPTSDISLNHDAKSGSTGYNMINEDQPDGSSTYISQILSTFNSTKTSRFNCAVSSNDASKPAGKIKIRSVKVVTYWTTVTSANSVNGTLTPSVALGNGSYTSGMGTSKTNTSENYNTATETNISNLPEVGEVYENIDALNLKLQISTSGRYTSN